MQSLLRWNEKQTRSVKLADFSSIVCYLFYLPSSVVYRPSRSRNDWPDVEGIEKRRDEGRGTRDEGRGKRREGRWTKKKKQEGYIV